MDRKPMSYAYNRRKKNRKQMKKPPYLGLSLREFCERRGLALPKEPQFICSEEYARLYHSNELDGTRT